MWYPTVPSPGLYLNESSFIGESPLTSGYQPLAWIHFGGSKGMYLQSIRGICVNRGSPCSIEFEYDTEDIPAGVRKLGRRMTTDFSRFTRFQIDGGAGEFIEAVYVNTDRAISETDCRFWKHGMLRSFKVSKSILKTNCIIELWQCYIFIPFPSCRLRPTMGGQLTLSPIPYSAMNLPWCHYQSHPELHLLDFMQARYV